MNLEYAQKWAELRGSDTAAFADLYAGDLDFTLEHTMVDDHMKDTIFTRDQIVDRLGGFANDDASNGLGVHTFTVTKYTGDERWGMVEWDYTVEGIASFRGIDNPEGKTLSTNGSTFLKFDANGKIVLDSTVMNDCPVFEALGVPIMRPHYWDADFDPASLMA